MIRSDLTGASRRHSSGVAPRDPPGKLAAGHEKVQKQLDEALEDSFPASDPVSIVTSQDEQDWGARAEARDSARRLLVGRGGVEDESYRVFVCLVSAGARLPVFPTPFRRNQSSVGAVVSKERKVGGACPPRAHGERQRWAGQARA